MGAVHDDVAVHQFGVPLDHTPEVGEGGEGEGERGREREREKEREREREREIASSNHGNSSHHSNSLSVLVSRSGVTPNSTVGPGMC